MKVKCPNCGQINTEEQLDHCDFSNEEGEEYCTLELNCTGCDALLYEGSEWGEWEYINQQEVYKEIEDYFKELRQ